MKQIHSYTQKYFEFIWVPESGSVSHLMNSNWEKHSDYIDVLHIIKNELIKHSMWAGLSLQPAKLCGEYYGGLKNAP